MHHVPHSGHDHPPHAQHTCTTHCPGHGTATGLLMRLPDLAQYQSPPRTLTTLTDTAAYWKTGHQCRDNWQLKSKVTLQYLANAALAAALVHCYGSFAHPLDAPRARVWGKGGERRAAQVPRNNRPMAHISLLEAHTRAAPRRRLSGAAARTPLTCLPLTILCSQRMSAFLLLLQGREVVAPVRHMAARGRVPARPQRSQRPAECAAARLARRARARPASPRTTAARPRGGSPARAAPRPPFAAWRAAPPLASGQRNAVRLHCTSGAVVKQAGAGCPCVGRQRCTSREAKVQVAGARADAHLSGVLAPA